jgi:hypothetical protein
VVGPAAQRTVGVGQVVDERDRVVVAAERGAGQGQPANGRLEGLLDRVPPAAGVPGVVHLVEHDQGAPVLGAGPVQQRVRGDTGVGDRDAGVVRGGASGRVAEVRVDGHPDLGRGLRPLLLEVLGGRHHGDRVDHPVGAQLGGHAQREGRLAGPGRGHGQEVLRGRGQVAGQRAALPGPERAFRPLHDSGR